MSANWPKAASLVAPHMSAFGGKGTWRFALHMSAFDPKRTSAVLAFFAPSSWQAKSVRCSTLSLGATMRRRQFIKLIAGSAASWPFAAHAQQPDRMRRIGVLMSLTADDAEAQARLAAFVRGLRDLGRVEGRDVRIDVRWTGNADNARKPAAELVALAPDIILASGGTVVGALLQATRTVPIVFTNTADPVGGGLVASLSRPGGNATGFISTDYGMSGKWLELLKEIAPRVTRAAVLRDPAIPQGIGQFGAIQSAAPSLGLEVSPVNVSDAGELERDVTAFAGGANGGMIVTGSGITIVHRDLIVTLAAQ